MSWIDNAIGIHAQALKFRAERSSVLAANIANADTPGYKARDFDFKEVLRAAEAGQQGIGLRATRPGHIAAAGGEFGDLMYRVPTREMTHGNSVETEVEQSAFADNAVRYQASLEFLGGSFSGLIRAFRGE